LLNSVHPSLLIFINALKKENNISLLKVEQLLSGISLRKNKVYSKITRIILNSNNNSKLIRRF